MLNTAKSFTEYFSPCILKITFFILAQYKTLSLFQLLKINMSDNAGDEGINCGKEGTVISAFILSSGY